MKLFKMIAMVALVSGQSAYALGPAKAVAEVTEHSFKCESLAGSAIKQQTGSADVRAAAPRVEQREATDNAGSSL